METLYLGLGLDIKLSELIREGGITFIVFRIRKVSLGNRVYKI